MSSTSTTWTTDTNTKSGTVQVYESNVSVLRILGIEGGNAILDLFADQGDDNADKWRMWVNASDNDLHFANYTSGAWANLLTIQDGGNIGIGTDSPTQSLTVSGHIDTAEADGTGDVGTSGNRMGTFYGLNTYVNTTRVASGNTTNPAVVFGGATTDTAGLYYPALRELGFVTGTSERMRIDPDGNVGIGETDPDTVLHIKQNTTSVTDLLTLCNISGADATSGSNLLFTTYADEGICRLSAQKNPTDDATVKLHIQTWTGSAWNTGLVMDSAGNVGIGEDDPSGKLNIKETGTVQAGLYVDTARYGILAIGDGTSNSQYLLKLQGNGGSTEAMYVGSSGNVGIGETDPEAKLTIKGDPANTDQPVRITNSVVDLHTALFINGTGAAINEKYGLQFGGYNEYSIGGIFGVMDSVTGSTSGDITIDFANGTSAGALIEKVRFTHEGNVGIGTSSPAFASGGGLMISNDDQANVRLADGSDYVDVANSAGDFYIINRKSDGELKFRVNTSTEAMTIIEDGKVGIGTDSPLTILDIKADNPILTLRPASSNTDYSSTIRFQDTQTDNFVGAYIQYDSSANNLVLGVHNTSDKLVGSDVECIVLSRADGNVGIGTDDPQTLLNLDQTGYSHATNRGLMLSVSSTVAGDNNYGGSIIFGELDSNTSAGEGSAIASVQTGSDNQHVGLAFMTHDSASGGAARTEAMRIEHDGKIGIGTDAPVSLLDLQYESTLTSTTLASAMTAGLTLNGGAAVDSNDYFPAISWYSDDGNLDSSEYRVGAITCKAAETFDGANNAGVDMQFFVHKDSTDSNGPALAMTIQDDGKVGIGISGVSRNLEILDDASTSIVRITSTGNDNYAGLEFYRETSAGEAKGGAWIGVKGDTATTNGVLEFGTGSNQSITSGVAADMVIDSSGNVGIGETSPTATLHIERDNDTQPTFYCAMTQNGTTSSGTKLFHFKTTGTAGTEDGDLLCVETARGASSEFHLIRALNSAGDVFNVRVDGNVGIGTAAPDAFLQVKGDAAGTAAPAICHLEDSDTSNTANNVILWIESNDATPEDDYDYILISDGGGEIGVLNSGSGVIDAAFTQSSDVRLKKNIVDTSLKGLETLNKIKIRDFEWNEKHCNGKYEDKKAVGMYIADEVHEVYPVATHGTPGAVKEDGSIDAMGVCQGTFISLMMKAIQELSAKVTALENA